MTVQALFLDFGGTLAHERTSRADLYCRGARAHGLEVSEEAMAFAMGAAHARLPRRVDGAFRYSDLWFRSYIAHVFAGLGLVGERSGLERTLLGLFSDAANFEVFPDVRELLERAAAMPVAVVSNWGERLEPLLEGLGLTVDLAMSSALEEVEKPDPEIFHRALARLGVEPGRVLHIGDRADTDVAGARAAGIRAVLLDRSGRMSPPPGVRVVNGLAEVEL